MVIIKSDEEIAIMRKCGKILAAILDKLRTEVKPGIKTGQLDTIMAEQSNKRGVIPSFKDYRGFPANLCVSVNDEIVHGIPGERVLQEGDLVSLDVGARLDGFHTDAAITVGVGRISKEAEELSAVTEGSLKSGIAQAINGAWIEDISSAIQHYVESRGFSVVREYTGHGVGRDLHEEPPIPNFAFGKGIRLRKGITLAIEPMVNVGDWHTKLAANQWTVLTADGSLSAHFEHTVAISDTGAEILV
ncbi:MAG: type I methionyl aminopeptidase [Dehalococcoidia bacterium]|nr:type I methionyl aminopeptidase [Dehalococcoidia bacterium]MCK5182312.1 type I methionyl aminopeptidase [Dehalococcoidia bacterium]